MSTKDLFSFPSSVNEVSARLVAAGVVVLAALTLALQEPLIIAPLAFGFVTRALAGPRFSPLGRLVTQVVTPRLQVRPKYVAGPPKRFAQTIGAGISLAALALAFGFGQVGAAYWLIGMIDVFATLESVFGFCVACKIFGGLMDVGLIPQQVCAECANIWSQPGMDASAPSTRNTLVKE